MVDLYSGETADRMTMMRIGLRRRIRWHIFLIFVGLGVLVVPGIGEEIRSIVPALSILGFVAGLGMKAFAPTGVLQVFFTKETMRRLQLQRLPALGMLGLTIALAIFADLIDVVPWQQARFEAVVGGIIVLLLIASAVMWMRRKVLYYRERSGNAFLVRGVHPEAIRMLAEMGDRPT